MSRSPTDAAIATYARMAEAYDRTRTRTLLERPYLSALGECVPAPASVLDLGCGMGEPIARALIDRGYQVTGVDAAAPMIERCKARFPAGHWLVADMRALPPLPRFAAVIAWDSMFHLTRDEQRAMFPILATLVQPGGALMFTSGPEDGEVTGHVGGAPVYHASLSPAEYRARLADQGFDVRMHRVSDPECGDHTVWLAVLLPSDARR